MTKQFRKMLILIPNLTGKCNSLFESFKHIQLITKKELKYFHFEFKKTCNLGELYLLSKIHKQLSNVSVITIISNCGVPTEKVSFILKTGDFINKSCKLGKMPDNAILVTADILGLDPSIPHNIMLRALKEALDKL